MNIAISMAQNRIFPTRFIGLSSDGVSRAAGQEADQGAKGDDSDQGHELERIHKNLQIVCLGDAEYNALPRIKARTNPTTTRSDD